VYTEMLTENMVTDPSRRSQYLGTLHAEAGRLSHLVENVLAYARLENSPKAPSGERITVGELVESTRERLRERAAQAGMTLVVEKVEAPDRCLNLDPSVVLQILFNLVDNACKYAAAAQDKRVHIETGQARGLAVIKVRDHGPGVSREFRGKLFRPFSKSAREAAHSAPGVGLGLALSRRLARRMGGDLALEEREEGGACFVLTLPLAGAGD
jgi:signal transduction histidine kinase